MKIEFVTSAEAAEVLAVLVHEGRAFVGMGATVLDRAPRRTPDDRLLAIVAGSKVSTKLTILQSLSAKVDGLIVGGGIANTFMLAAGLKIGKSLAEPDLVGEAKAVIAAMAARGAAVPIPVDVVCAKSFAADAPATVKAACPAPAARPLIGRPLGQAVDGVRFGGRAGLAWQWPGSSATARG